MKNLRAVMDKIMRVLNVAVLVGLVLLVVWQVITRYFLSQPSVWSEELASYGFAWATMLGAAYVFGLRDHMNVDVAVLRFSLKTQKLLAIFSELLILIFAVTILIYGGVQNTLLTIEQLSSSLPVTMGYLYSIVPISGVFIAIYNILNIHDIINADELNTGSTMEEEEA